MRRKLRVVLHRFPDNPRPLDSCESLAHCEDCGCSWYAVHEAHCCSLSCAECDSLNTIREYCDELPYIYPQATVH